MTYTRKDRRLDFAAVDEFTDFILGGRFKIMVLLLFVSSHYLLIFSEHLSSEVVSETCQLVFNLFSSSDGLLSAL